MSGPIRDFDLIIIGAGPAGTSSAIFLSRLGYRVLLLDQSRFPRDKVCGEFISPAADAILAELGVLAAIQAVSPLRLEGITLSSYETDLLSVDYPPMPATGQAMTSLSVPRLILDQALLARALEAGVTVREEHKVTDFIFKDGNVAGVEGRDAGNSPFRFSSRLVVDAGGRNSVSIRRFNLKKKGTRESKIALAAHWDGEAFPRRHCYMHISRPGYTGMAPVGNGRVNVVLVVDARELQGRELNACYKDIVLRNGQRRSLLQNAVVGERVRSVDSLAFDVKPLQCGGLVLVGDATGFIDPFTGEGIYLSLRSSKIASGVIDTALRGNDVSRKTLAEYDRIREDEFRKKFLLSRILQRLIYNQPLCGVTMRTLSQTPHLAKTLIGVIGDYIPPEEVLSLKFLLRLLLKIPSAKQGTLTQ